MSNDRNPVYILKGDELALAAALYVRDYKGVEMNFHETTLAYTKYENGDQEFSAKVEAKLEQ